MKVKQVKIPYHLVNNVPEGATVVRPVVSVCEYCIYSGKDCPKVLTGDGDVVPSCNVFGNNAFFIADTVKFTEEGLCDLIISTKPDGSKHYIIDTVESYKPNHINLCTQLLTHAALSSAYFSDKSMIEVLDAARMFFGADIVENARKLVSSYNSQPDVGKPYPK